MSDETKPGRETHVHEFAVDAACECGMMISTLIRMQKADLVRAGERIAALEAKVKETWALAHEESRCFLVRAEKVEADARRLAEAARAVIESCRDWVTNEYTLSPTVAATETLRTALAAHDAAHSGDAPPCSHCEPPCKHPNDSHVTVPTPLRGPGCLECEGSWKPDAPERAESAAVEPRCICGKPLPNIQTHEFDGCEGEQS